MLRLAPIFQDWMILQREKPIRIWGFSDGGQSLSFYLNDRLIAENIDVDGHFSICLPAQQAAENAELTIKGEHDVLGFNHVDIGEIWVAGGQSNMELPLIADIDGKRQIRKAHDPHLRFYDVGKYAFEGEEEEGLIRNPGWNTWLPFTSRNAQYFSAVGLYFAQKLRDRYHVPVGIVGCNWGGTTASAWLDESYLLKTPELNVYLEEYQAMTKDIDLEKYEKERIEARKILAIPAFQRLSNDSSHGLRRLLDKIAVMHISPEQIMKAVTLVGPKSFNRPGGLFHSMVKQIAGFTCRGVIWYQGESDSQKAENYHILFSSVIDCWRKEWKDALPFLFVQLAPFDRWRELSGENFPVIREKQEWVSKHVPDTYMISIMDAGVRNDIHPKNKRPVGERLALLSRGKVYDEEILCEAPELLKISLAEGNLKLRFAHAGEGLHLVGNKLNAFHLDIDQKEMTGFSVIVSSDFIHIQMEELNDNSRIDVCFACEPYCEVNLYNSAGIPAKPFRWTNRPK